MSTYLHGRRFALQAALLLITLVTIESRAAAQTARFNPPKQYYLALGDSVAYGYQQSKVVGGVLQASAFDTGYVDLFAARLREIARWSTLVNYSCPGESTISFTDLARPCPFTGAGQLHDHFDGTQLDAAKAFLRAHPGEVSPITVTLWGNDVRQFVANCRGEDVCVRNGAVEFIVGFSGRLGNILAELRKTAPDAEIIVTGSWDSFIDALEFADPLFQVLNASMSRVAAATRVRFADPFPVFNPQGDLAREIEAMCTLTLLCTENDSHPSDPGYRALADLVFDTSEYWRLTP